MISIKVSKGCPFTEKQINTFLSHVADDHSGCLVWTGCNIHGYGRVTIGGKLFSSHRVAWEIANGPIPDGQVVRHKCDNPPCVNPEHLELGTYKENSGDMVARGRSNGPRGERSGNAVLTLKNVSVIKQHLIAGTKTQAELARTYDCSVSAINAIRLNITWRCVSPLIPIVLPIPHRKYSNADYLLMRQLWRDGWKLKDIAEKYEARVDVIQSIISGKRGKGVAIGERPNRQNSTKHTPEIRAEIRRRYASGETQLALAKEYGLSKNGMCNLINEFCH